MLLGLDENIPAGVNRQTSRIIRECFNIRFDPKLTDKCDRRASVYKGEAARHTHMPNVGLGAEASVADMAGANLSDSRY
jgi:hypothetical protein